MEKRTIILDFLDLYLKTRSSKYNKKEISLYKELVELGVICEDKDNDEMVVISGESPNLQGCVLDLAETKLSKSLPLDISDAFKFIIDFDKLLKQEYNCTNYINSFDTIIKGLRVYVINYLYHRGIDVKTFLLTLDNEKSRAYHLSFFENSFLTFLPNSDYSDKEIFEIINYLWNKEDGKYTIRTGLHNFPINNFQKSEELLVYANANGVSTEIISELLIGLYNAGEISFLDKIFDLKKKSASLCLNVLSRLNFRNIDDIENAFQCIGELGYNDKELATQQSFMIRRVLENKLTPKHICEKAFLLYEEFLQNGTNEIIEIVFFEIRLIDEYETEKYNLLFLYLSKTKHINVIKDFFFQFKNPAYIFDLLMKSFSAKPDYIFSMSLFENGIRHVWSVNQTETEKCILNLFNQHPVFGILGVKVLFTAYHGIYHIDFLRLYKDEYQVNAINSICRFPHSFDKLLPLILPLRNSKFKGVRKHLQKRLAQKVFNSYHESIYNEIEIGIGKNKKDKMFLEPIKKALDDYNKLKELKNSINDLNPRENESDLINLYYRLEHERNAKMQAEVGKGKGTFMELFKSTIIVRGNSFKIDERPPMPLATIESKLLIDGSHYLNPDLYEHNLNIIQ